MMLPKIYNFIKTWLNKLLDIGIVTVILGLVIILFVNVFLRYVVSKPLYWSEEISLFGIVFFTFIGGAALVRKKKKYYNYNCNRHSQQKGRFYHTCGDRDHYTFGNWLCLLANNLINTSYDTYCNSNYADH